MCTQLDWPIFFSSAEATSIDVDSFRGDGLHAWVGSSAECVDAWHKFSCAYTYDRCDPADGSVVKGKDAPSCRSRCENVVRCFCRITWACASPYAVAQATIMEHCANTPR